MGTAGFPAWPVRTEGVIAPDERLPWPQTFAMGAQHVVAMFGATVLAPLLMGFDPNVAVLMSGVGTLVFAVTIGRLVEWSLGIFDKEGRIMRRRRAAEEAIPEGAA